MKRTTPPPAETPAPPLRDAMALLDSLAGPDSPGTPDPLRVPPEQLERLVQALGAGSPPDDPRDAKRRRIIRASTALFLRHGFRKTSMDEVARAANVAKGTLYLYVKNKAELLVQAIYQEKARNLDRFRTIVAANLPPRQLFREWLRLFFLGLPEMPLTARMITGDREVLLALEELGSSLKEDMVDVQTHMVARLIDRAAAPHGLTPAQLQDRAGCLMALLYAAPAVLDHKLRAGMTRERQADLLVDLIMDGVVAPAPRQP